MKALLDTNIIIDVLERREPFFKDSYKLIQLNLQEKLETVISAGTITDVYYIINRSIHDANKAKEKIIALATLINICDTTTADINAALAIEIPDFEDAVIVAIAKRIKADYIITRNETNFSNSIVPVLAPKQFLQKFFGGK